LIATVPSPTLAGSSSRGTTSNHRLPRGDVDRAARADGERDREEHPRLHQTGNRQHAQQRRHQEQPHLGDEQDASPVHDIGQGTPGKGEKEQRHGSSSLHQRDHQR